MRAKSSEPYGEMGQHDEVDNNAPLPDDHGDDDHEQADDHELGDGDMDMDDGGGFEE